MPHGVCPPAPVSRSGWLVTYTFTEKTVPPGYGEPVRGSSAGTVAVNTSVSCATCPESPSKVIGRPKVLMAPGYRGNSGSAGAPTSGVATPWAESVLVPDEDEKLLAYAVPVATATAAHSAQPMSTGRRTPTRSAPAGPLLSPPGRHKCAQVPAWTADKVQDQRRSLSWMT